MNQTSPKILPIKKFKNTTKIIKTYQENNKPIMLSKAQAASLINESLDDIENGSPLVNGEKFFETMRKKYGQK